MTGKPMSWAMAAAMLLLMAAFEFGLTMAFVPEMRHQVGSIHSLLWQVAVPGELIANAILVVGFRLAYNRLQVCPNCVNIQGHQSF
jgi:hypothetical protein